MGPRSSFILWEQAVGVVGEALDRGIAADEVSLVFAGGIHDARSAALVAALAGPLAARGVKVGSWSEPAICSHAKRSRPGRSCRVSG